MLKRIFLPSFAVLISSGFSMAIALADDARVPDPVALNDAATQILQGPDTNHCDQHLMLEFQHTRDSNVWFAGHPPQTTQTIQFQIKKLPDGIMRTEEFAWAPGDPNPNAILPFGPGQYRVTVNYLPKQPGAIAATYIITNTDTEDLSFLSPSDEVQSEDDEISDLATQITQGQTTDMGKVQAVHDWLINNIKPDNISDNTPYLRSAVEVLHDKQGVCTGFSYLNAALLRNLGIQTRVMGGTTTNSLHPGDWEPHAWNQVYVDGAWINEDVLKDAVWTRASHMKKMSNRFLGTDDAKFSLSHQDAEVDLSL